MLAPVVDGWQASWTYRFTSGLPVAGMNYAYKCADSMLTPDQSHDHWFNNTASCWATLPTYTIRTVDDRYAWLRQMDNIDAECRDERRRSPADRAVELQPSAPKPSICDESPAVRRSRHDAYTDARFGTSCPSAAAELPAPTFNCRGESSSDESLIGLTSAAVYSPDRYPLCWRAR